VGESLLQDIVLYISFFILISYGKKTLIDNYLGQKVGKPNLIFIDSAPGDERKLLVDKYRDIADVIVIHDTEEGAQDIYGTRDVLNSFKYRLDYYPVGMPGTTALSNTVNVCEWV